VIPAVILPMLFFKFRHNVLLIHVFIIFILPSESLSFKQENGF
jgi:hypothetical protein